MDLLLACPLSLLLYRTSVLGTHYQDMNMVKAFGARGVFVASVKDCCGFGVCTMKSYVVVQRMSVYAYPNTDFPSLSAQLLDCSE